MSYDLGKVVGATGKGISSITKTSTSGLVDTYTVLFSDGTSTTFNVTNGAGQVVTSWEETPSDTKVASEKLVKNALDSKASSSHVHDDRYYTQTEIDTALVAKQATLVSGTNIKTINNKSLLGSGNINISGGGGGADIVTSWEETLSDEKVPSEKLTKNTIDNLNIPTKISDLTNDSDFIETSSTSGLIKNDGSVMTSGTGSSNWAVGNHTHSGYVSATKVTSWSSTTSDSNVPSEKLVKDTIDTKINTSDIANNLTTTSAGKVLDARQGKALADLIGNAINYINL